MSNIENLHNILMIPYPGSKSTRGRLTGNARRDIQSILNSMSGLIDFSPKLKPEDLFKYMGRQTIIYSHSDGIDKAILSKKPAQNLKTFEEYLSMPLDVDDIEVVYLGDVSGVDPLFVITIDGLDRKYHITMGV
jgi:hypothetical protein